MLQPSLPRWRQRFIAVLLLAFLTTAALTPTRPAHAQESPLPTPTSVQMPSPLPSPTAGDAGTAATTAAPSSLAGTALTSPGAIAVTVLVALVAIGGLVRYRQRA